MVYIRMPPNSYRQLIGSDNCDDVDSWARAVNRLAANQMAEQGAEADGGMSRF